VFLFVTTQVFFLVIGGAALIASAAVRFLDDPSGQRGELMQDGNVQMIDVS